MRPEGLWLRARARRRMYRAALKDTGVAGAVVLADLARFCHAEQTTHVVGDTHGSAQLEGRRQVWLRIQGYLRLSDAQLEQLREQAAQEEGDVA